MVNDTASHQKQATEQDQFSYSPLGKAFEKNNWISGQNQIDALKNLKTNIQELTTKNIIASVILNGEGKNELNNIK